jgi:putative aminopeptidase FrvX
VEFDLERVKDFLIGLLNTPSPTGHTEAAIAYVEAALQGLPVEVRRTRKGALTATWAGRRDDAPRALTAHVDTLGAMVKEIKSNGRLRLTRIGGYAWNTIEGEGVTVLASGGRRVRGTVLLAKSSSHVYGAETGTAARDEAAMEVRLDERTLSAAESEALGIRVGDFVALDPRVEAGPAGFIRGRHLDDKAGVAAMVGVMWALHAAGAQPAQRTTFHFSNYEEVGHGAAAGLPPDLADLVTVDMAAIGEGQTSDEFSVTICAKDSGGPYEWSLTQHLIQLAEAERIPYRVDIYPYYGSDGEAAWRAGGDLRVALVGPGVDASHNYERTHLEAVARTMELLAAYVRHEG